MLTISTKTGKQSLLHGFVHFITIYLLFQLVLIAKKGEAIRCFQCSSDEDKSKDNCGAYDHFDTQKNTAVECMGEDAVTPGKINF